MAKLGERMYDWTVRHKWQYRTSVVTVYVLLIGNNLLHDRSWWRWMELAFLVSFIVSFALLWRRMDAMEEFAERTRAAIGSDAYAVIVTARLQLRTRTIVTLNRVMRRYDIMATPVLDLPPEAKELRLILESQVDRNA